jgi:hypothetical protein
VRGLRFRRCIRPNSVRSLTYQTMGDPSVAVVCGGSVIDRASLDALASQFL